MSLSNVHVAAQQRRNQLGCRAIGDDGKFGSRYLLEQVRGKILRAARIDGTEIELAGILLRSVDDILERLVGRIARHGEQHLETGRHRNGGEILQHVKGKLVEERGADRLAIADLTKRVAVGGTAQHLRRRRDAARSRAVLDHELLLELLAELVGQ
jgi:hypothetical protein